MASKVSRTANRDIPIFGGPTKRFFVDMLTRDIGLKGAILDLLDNCVDGAMRQRQSKLDKKKPFSGLSANIKLSRTSFAINDNCGGIEENYIAGAFTLGRPNMQQDGNIPTIGMYGIGMKRAIFKMGTTACVTSNSINGHFKVDYTSKWLEPSNDDWDLPIQKSKTKSSEKGVSIHISKLKPEIAKQFANSSFVNSLADEISTHFCYLIQKGFTVNINGKKITPKELHLFSKKPGKNDEINSFDYTTMHGKVEIKVTVGFFRSLAKADELEREIISPSNIETAGVSVLCNDRVILLNDRTITTGWGDGTVPRYHPQFRSIAALVTFNSNSANELPVSTTKRDLDTNTEVYFSARKATMEGLKIFTDFTNRWKGMEDDTQKLFLPSNKTEARRHIDLAKSHGKSVRGDSNAKKFRPTLPSPKATSAKTRISFSRNQKDVQVLSNYLFSEGDVSPSDVGAQCFDQALKKAKR